ncbi:MAG: class I SAM-dependent methyltransferase [Gammaproteobacteria bacterium]|nr:class I SAM-dependent methyltransferase [Gammaproteobacteria bacterium]
MTGLRQTGRAGLEFLGSLQHFSSGQLRPVASRDFYADPDMEALGDAPLGDRSRGELEAILGRAKATAAKSQAFRFERFYQRLVAEDVYNRGIPAAEELRPSLKAMAETPVDMSQAGSLTLDPSLEQDDYYEGVEWHLMPGGWDGYDLAGPMFMLGVGPMIFSRGGYAAVEVDADISQQRMQVLGELPRRDYRRVYEAGCGGVPTIIAIRKSFPEAEIVASDLSTHMLKAGHRVAGMLKLNVHLKQEDCRRTSEPDNHYDAVVSYAVFHEMDDQAALACLREMFRIMAPGGDIVISDPGPVRACTPFQAVLYDWETEHREEPWFTASVLRSLPQMMREIGYVDVQEYPLEQGPYPWITRGSKPV